MNFKEDILEKVNEGAMKIFWFLSIHAFSLILVFVVLDLAFGTVIFYKEIFSAQTALPSATGEIAKFDKVKFQAVLDELDSRGF